ncbi:MAG: DUF1822 family protein [Leptolyngbyaceae cyanobacterium SM2_5_2]|nr:DUF1822 family protein [Leptolyngbyaceae cyanobacterium SM2_5_2]
MKGPLTYSDQPNMDFETLPIQTITLSQHQVEQAVEISDRVITEPRQWQTYLNALALFALQGWFTEQTPDLVLDWQQCSILKPQYANVIEAVYDLKINDFKLCLMAIGSPMEAVIKLPRAVVDLADFRSHLYILVRVLEEQGQAQVLSFLRHDQWLAHQRSTPLTPTPDWTYPVPSHWFEDDLHRLLLCLHGLKPQAISELSSQLRAAPTPNRLQQDLTQRLAQAASVETPLWQLLTWDEGARVLTHPPLLDWLYQVQTGQLALRPASEISSTSALRPILDAGAWLRNELDEMAQALGWLLLPPLAEMRSLNAPSPTNSPAVNSAVDSMAETLELLRRQLARQGTVLPADARCAYKAVTLANAPLALYAITWLVPDDQGRPAEWALLLVLNRLSNDPHQLAVTLSISDSSAPLVEQQLAAATDCNSVYAQVVGTWGEEFHITLIADAGETLTWPAITLHRGDW